MKAYPGLGIILKIQNKKQKQFYEKYKIVKQKTEKKIKN